MEATGDSANGNNTDSSDIALSYAASAGDFLIAAAVDNATPDGGQTAGVPTISGDNSPTLLQGAITEDWGNGGDGGFAHWYAGDCLFRKFHGDGADHLNRLQPELGIAADLERIRSIGAGSAGRCYRKCGILKPDQAFLGRRQPALTVTA